MSVNVHNIISNGYGGAVVSIAGGGGTIIPVTILISGATIVGNILTAVSIGVIPTSWQWYLNNTPIAGATGSTYTTTTTGVITVKVNNLFLSAGVNITAAVNQTFRSIGALGANIEYVNSTNGNRLYRNAFYNGARMQKPGQPFVNCNRDATTGWPTEAFYVILSASPSNGTSYFEGAVPSGTYNWSYSYDNTIGTTTLTLPTSGSNTPVNSGVIGFSLGTPVVTGNITKVPFSFSFTSVQGTLNLSFDGPITFCDCPLDGASTTVGQPMFRDEALASYSQYGVLRTLDIINIGRFDINWADRSPNYTGPQIAQDVPSWERLCALMLAIKNYPGSKLQKWMVNLPMFSDPASYAVPLATLFNNAGVPANFCEFEYGNEPFNFGAATKVRFSGWENAAMNTVKGIANWELYTNPTAPSALYQSPGQIISGVSIDTAGNVTVTLTVPCSSVLDLNGNPFITVGATAIVNSIKAQMQAGGLAPDISRTVTINSVGTTTFTYNTGVATTTAATLTAGSAAQAYHIIFDPTNYLLSDNLSTSIGNLQKKWWMNRLKDFQTQWLTVRDKASYNDNWYVNITPIGGAALPGSSKTRPFEIIYGNWLGGGNAANWLDALATATYVVPGGLLGSVASLDNMFDSTKTDSLYYQLNNPALGQNVDNQSRGLVWQCLVSGIKPITYEGGIGLQTITSSSYAVLAATDPRTETYLTAHQQVVLRNGTFRYMNFNSSPRIVLNGSTGNSAWQSMQFFNDSINSGDVTYSARKAALEKFNDNVFYTNIHGNDLTTLNANQYQNATVLTGNDNFSVFNNATTGVYYWGTGSTAFNRNMDWVYCNNTLTSRTITVYGTDSQTTAVQVWIFPPDLSGGTSGVLLGTVNLPNKGNAGVSTSIPDVSTTLSWTPTMKGPHVFRLVVVAGTGTQPGFLKVTFT